MPNWERRAGDADRAERQANDFKTGILQYLFFGSTGKKRGEKLRFRDVGTVNLGYNESGYNECRLVTTTSYGIDYFW